MPWLDTTKKSTPTAKDIIGMESDELKAKLDSAATKEDLTALQTTVTSSLAELQQTLKGLKPEATPNEDDHNEPPPDGTIELLTDPQKFINKSLTPIISAQLENQASLMEMRARQNAELSPYFAQYGKELTDAAAKLPIQTRATVGFWEWHIRTIVGDKVVKGEIREGKFPSLIGTSSVNPAVGAATGKDPKHGFSKEQLDWFTEHKIPVESAAAITNMYNDGEPITQTGYKTYKQAVASNA